MQSAYEDVPEDRYTVFFLPSVAVCTIAVQHAKSQSEIKRAKEKTGLSPWFGGDEWMLPWLPGSVLINATQASLLSCETKSIFHPEDMTYKLRGH